MNGEWPPKSRTGVIVGSVIGSLCGVALVVVIAVLVWRHYRVAPSAAPDENPLT
jgi:TctA family transporter